MLIIENLNICAKNSPDNLLVNEVSLFLPEKNVYNLVGETGSGKSLLALAVAGLLSEDLQAQGRITINGLSSRPARNEQAQASTFLVPQEPGIALNPTLKVKSQVAEIFRWPRAKPRKQSMARAASILVRLGLSGTAVNSYPHELSGGMKQRCAIAMALASPAPLIIVDEPTKGLDAHLKDQVVDLLKKLVKNGKTLLCITHDFTVAGLLGGQTGVMLQGKIIEQGVTEQVLHKPEAKYTRDLIRALPENGLCAPL
ncbi:ATP-binding cassette domain-containing protein [Desulfonatronovibrio hydrogenovorans]|uniref:ATP-binding cassette domain-containing protein n=1 Tax=Desulfonatronovibrio hydrogenovorans TaxID=53245 RepID=UPI00048BD0B0|nr:ATP-binding cassette domain-containing protein [Desulfonatronovibrio hydrogenovorans]